MSRTRRRLPVEAHEAVFARVLELLEESGLLSGKTLGIDSTTLEGNAAMRSIVRRDTGEGYQLFRPGRGVGDRDAEPCGSGEAGPEAAEEGVQR